MPRARGQQRGAHATRAPGAPARAAQRSVRRRRLTHRPTRGSRRCALERKRQSVLQEEGPPVPVALTVTLHRCTGVHYKRRRNTKACNRRYVRYSDPRGAYEIPRVYAACCATAGLPAWGLRAEEGGAMRSRQQGLALQSLGLWKGHRGEGEERVGRCRAVCPCCRRAISQKRLPASQNTTAGRAGGREGSKKRL